MYVHFRHNGIWNEAQISFWELSIKIISVQINTCTQQKWALVSSPQRVFFSFFYPIYFLRHQSQSLIILSLTCYNFVMIHRNILS